MEKKIRMLNQLDDFPRVAAGHQYALDILDGKIPACEWVKLACQRHLTNLEDSGKSFFPYRFDVKRAAYPIQVIETFPHMKGQWAARGETLALEPWQLFITASIFGWIHEETELRRFRKVFILVPRKNAKSTWAAAVGNYMLACDDEHGAEVYAGATSEKQAMEVFKPALSMVRRTNAFRERFGILPNVSNISIPGNDSKFEPIIGKPGDGASPSCSIHDEFHEHDTNDQYDTMDTGMGARLQPLQVVTSTAGKNLAGPCYKLQKDMERVLQGSVKNERAFAIVYTIDKGDRWDTMESAKKANPNFGVSVMEEYLEAQLNDAIQIPRKQNTYKTKHLDIWCASMSAYFDVPKWQNCGVPGLTLDEFEGQPCILGLDLASRVDIAALEITFKLSECDCMRAEELRRMGRRFARFGIYWLPEKTIELPENEHYRDWLKEGWIRQTDGAMIDFDEIEEEILGILDKDGNLKKNESGEIIKKGLVDRFHVLNIAYDPYQATMLMTRIDKHGAPIVEVRPSVLTYSEPMKDMEGLIRDEAYAHDGDPVMEWSIANVVAKEDRKGNVYPNKETDELKIDPAVAHISAMALWNAETEGFDLDKYLESPAMVA